ncbi:MAG: hypothetical protein ACR2MG_17500 [Pyrinomonadaceae bacterium]
MLIIREEQIQHFIAADEEQLVEVVSRAIREANPARVADYDDKKLGKMVKIGIERAKSHELTRGQDIAAFVAVMFEVAPKFDEQEEIKTILNETMFPADERFYQLFERVSDDVWEEAEKLYEDTYWFPANAESNG